jgi:hypothetical protein
MSNDAILKDVSFMNYAIAKPFLLLFPSDNVLKRSIGQCIDLEEKLRDNRTTIPFLEADMLYKEAKKTFQTLRRYINVFANGKEPKIKMLRESSDVLVEMFLHNEELDKYWAGR